MKPYENSLNKELRLKRKNRPCVSLFKFFVDS